MQHQRYREILGKNVPKGFDKWQELKYNDSEKWRLLKDYYTSRKNNAISAFSTFEDYKKYKKIIDDEIVGIVTTDGVTITGQSKHFIERVLGTSEDPKNKRPRSGVEIEDIKEALLRGTAKHRKDSLRYVSDSCIVSVNRKNGKLIQTNPQ